MYKRYAIIAAACFVYILMVILKVNFLHAQATFARYYSNNITAYFYSIAQTSDGGYIAAGVITPIAYEYEMFILKLDSSGNVQWKRSVGGAEMDKAYSIAQTSDGSYIVGASTYSYEPTSYLDIFIFKLNSSGNIVWRRAFGGTNHEGLGSVAQTSDGGYIVAGSTYSYGAGNYDMLILKLNSSGNIVWRRTFGGANSDYAKSIAQTSDGGYIVAGGTGSYGAGNYDMLILKLNSSGNILWRRTFGGTDYDVVASIAQTPDGGYIVAGDTSSYGAGESDILVLKLNSSGNIMWRRTFGGTGDDYAYSIAPTLHGGNNGYVVSGESYSFVSGYYSDLIIIQLNSSGSIVWRRTAGGNFGEDAMSIVQTSDEGYIVAGQTSSYGNLDGFLLKLNSSGNIPGCNILAAPALSLTAPALNVSAPAIGVSAPALAVTAPVATITTPAITSGDACQ